MSQQIKNKKFITASLVLFLTVAVFLFWNYSLGQKDVLAASETFSYRKSITVNNTSNASTLTNYQVLITANTASLISAGKMISDCGDIRFTDNSISYNTGDWINNYPYWIESGCNTSSTKIWVKVDSIAASSNKTIYMYYGNSSAASLSSGDNTFIFFDDFTGATINTTKWSKTDSGGYIAQNNVLTISNGVPGWGSTEMHTNANFNRADGLVVQGKYKSTMVRGASYKDTTMLWVKDTGAGTNYPDFIHAFYPYEYGGTAYFAMYEDGTNRIPVSGTFTADTQYIIRQIIKTGGGALTQTSTDGGSTWTNNYDSTYSTETPFKVGFTHYQGGDVVIDDVIVRKYSSPEPTVLVDYISTIYTSTGLTCYVTGGSCSGTTVLKMNNYDNDHAELPSQSNYPYKICCEGTGLGTSCSGNYAVVLKLSGLTNAHVEKNTQSNYANNACLSKSSGGISCSYATTSCSLGTTCLASISGDTNAHIGDCDNVYSTKVCCSILSGPSATNFTVPSEEEVASDDLSCTVASSCATGTSVFKMYSASGGHAGLATSSFTNLACCSGVTGLGNSCSGNYDTALKLYSATDGHVQENTETGFTNNACLSVNSGDVDCTYADTTCPSGYKCLASISSSTNAHVGNCSAFTKKVCCSVSVNSDNSCWYCQQYFNTSNILESGANGQLDMGFDYTDGDATATLSGYRIALDTADLSLSNIDSDADVIVPSASTWVSGGSAVPSSTITNPSVSVKISPSAALKQIGYGNGTAAKTYYWWVKVKNSEGVESGWISAGSFKTPKKHYPVVRVVANKMSNGDILSAINKDVQFCSGTDLTNQTNPALRDACYSTCWTGTAGSAVVDPDNANWKCGVCYDSSNNPVSCSTLNDGATFFTWKMPAGLVAGTGYTLTTGILSDASPVIKFLTANTNVKMGLNITGSQCGGEEDMQIQTPLPTWREISPF